MSFELCFEGNVQLNGLYRDLFDNYVKFTPESTTFNRRVSPWDKKRHLPLLDSLETNETFAFSSDKGSFYTAVIRRSHPYRSVQITQDTESFLLPDEEVYSIVNRPGFIAGYIYNEDYECIQTIPCESNYSGRQFSEDIQRSIKNTPYKLNNVNYKVYNNSFNPGRSVSMDYLHLAVGWKMWFGDGFFKLVPKGKILNFPYATDLKELSTNLIYGQLYDNIETP